MRKVLLIALLAASALLLAACGGGSASSSGSATSSGDARSPEAVWEKEIEGVMRRFENASARSVEAIHTSTAQFHLEPTYVRYSDELAQLGKQLVATDPPASCERIRDEMGVLARRVSGIMGVLGSQAELSPEEYSALVYQQGFKFSRVGRRLTNLTIHPHC